MNDEDFSQVNQAQRERLSHIDFRAYFLGTVGRNDLVGRFGIKEAAATRDFALYRERAPNNLVYDTKERVYRYAEGFKPLFRYSAEQVLAALSNGFGEDFVGTQKPLLYCETPAQLNRPLLPALSVLTRAIYQKRVVEIRYHSLSSGPTTRQIAPFALVDNGLRWHVRAFDRRRMRFTDFVVTRIVDPVLVDSGISESESRDNDIQWNRIVELELVPHPRVPYPETIERDYAMQGGALNVNVRAAVAGYVLRRWNVDCTEDHSLEGDEYHLWLKNRQTLYGVDNLVLAPGYAPKPGS